MGAIRQYFDTGSLIVITLTLLLFMASLYFTGLTHDLLLEAGVFLVSVKLILMSYKLRVTSERLHDELTAIHSMLRVINEHGGPRAGEPPSQSAP